MTAPPRARVGPSRRALLAFFAVVVLVGFGCGLGTAPFSGFDEGRHFAHAWQVSDGRVFPLDGRDATGRPAQGGFVPGGVVHDMSTLFAEGRSHDAAKLFHRLGDGASGGRPTFVDFSNVASYSFVSYLPAAIGIRLGRMLGASTLLLMVLARLFGLIAYAALATLAVSRVPTRRALMAVVCLAPVAIAQAATVSADGITIGLSMVVIAEGLRLAVQPKGAVTRASCVEAGIALIALALAKPPYVLFGLVYLVAVVRQRGATAKILGVAGATAAATSAGWDIWASRHYVQQYFAFAQFNPHYYAFRGVDSTRQLNYVASAPWAFAAVVYRTMLLSRSHFGHDIAMQSPAWHAPSWMAGIELVVLVGAAAIAVDRSDISVVRTIAAVTVGVTSVAVFVLAYAGWNKVRAPHIDALDGRYFFPVLALLLLAVTPVFGRRLSEPTRHAATRAILAAQVVLVLVVAGMSVHDAYATPQPNLGAAPNYARPVPPRPGRDRTHGMEDTRWTSGPSSTPRAWRSSPAGG